MIKRARVCCIPTTNPGERRSRARSVENRWETLRIGLGAFLHTARASRRRVIRRERGFRRARTQSRVYRFVLFLVSPILPILRYSRALVRPARNFAGKLLRSHCPPARGRKKKKKKQYTYKNNSYTLVSVCVCVYFLISPFIVSFHCSSAAAAITMALYAYTYTFSLPLSSSPHIDTHAESNSPLIRSRSIVLFWLILIFFFIILYTLYYYHCCGVLQ